MKSHRNILILAIILQSVLLSACTGDDWIGNVKSGVFKQYDKVKPVGVVYDNWSSCQNTDWKIAKEDENYAEVQFTCNVSGVNDIVSALKENQKIIDEHNKLKVRKLEIEQADYLSRLQLDVCKTEFFIDKMSKGLVFKAKDSLLTEDELRSLANQYHQTLLEATNKAKSNSLLDESEVDKYTQDLSQISKQLEYEFDNSGSVFFQGNPHKLRSTDNKIHQEVQASLLKCMESIDSNSNYIGDERIIGDYRNIIYFFNRQQELASYKKQKKFDDLKSIVITVMFDVNKNNFEINSAYSEFLIGDKTEKLSYSDRTIQGIIYNNITLSAELTKENNIHDLVKLF